MTVTLTETVAPPETITRPERKDDASESRDNSAPDAGAPPAAAPMKESVAPSLSKTAHEFRAFAVAGDEGAKVLVFDAANCESLDCIEDTEGYKEIVPENGPGGSRFFVGTSIASFSDDLEAAARKQCSLADGDEVLINHVDSFGE